MNKANDNNEENPLTVYAVDYCTNLETTISRKLQMIYRLKSYDP